MGQFIRRINEKRCTECGAPKGRCYNCGEPATHSIELDAYYTICSRKCAEAIIEMRLDDAFGERKRK